MSTQKHSGIIISGISLVPNASELEALSVAAEELRRAGVSPARLNLYIYRRSVDARKRDDIRIVYSVAAKFPEPTACELPKLKKHRAAFLESGEIEDEIIFGSEHMSAPPLVVGMGPAGLFSALLLAERGYEPTIIDRGDCISKRCESYNRFVKYGILDTESNIQFGAGGAGTFSDGKLLTRINDAKIGYVLRRFCDFGAPETILTEAKPHIGTDLLREIVDRMLAHIERLGGRVLYRTRLDGIVCHADGSVTAKTTAGDIDCCALLLATGHSARDTYKMLIDSSYAVAPKSFSVGVRIEHLREDIDRALYGSMAGHPALGKGEYHLSDTSSGRGVYTFCMCPGGEVVAGASEQGGVVVNGMSAHARDGVNSNSAVAVSVRPEDYDGTPIGAIEFQRNIERAAYASGGCDFCAPVMTVGDLLDGYRGSEPCRIMPSYREGAVRVADMNKVLPSFVIDELKLGLRSFGRRISGFAAADAVLTGAETRTSAPVRVLRGENGEALGHGGVYPCGEGAGSAGGITSSAIDGIKAALKLMGRFSPN